MSNLFQLKTPGLVVGEATMEEWLAAGGRGILDAAGLEEMTGPKVPGKYVTLRDDRSVLEFNGLEETK